MVGYRISKNGERKLSVFCSQVDNLQAACHAGAICIVEMPIFCYHSVI